MTSTTMFEFPSTFIVAKIFKNYFVMVKSICAQSPLLVRLATVLVWQRAVNRQPSFRSGNSKGRSPSAFFYENLSISKKNPTFWRKKTKIDRTLKFKNHLYTWIPFLFTSICSPQQLWRFTSTCMKQTSLKTAFSWSRVSACSRPFWSA